MTDSTDTDDAKQVLKGNKDPRVNVDGWTGKKSPAYTRVVSKLTEMALVGSSQIYLVMIARGITLRGEPIGNTCLGILEENDGNNLICLLLRDACSDEEVGEITIERALEIVEEALIL